MSLALMASTGAQLCPPEAQTVARHSVGLHDLPPELHLEILRDLPDIPDLKNAVTALAPLYRTFAAYGDSVSTHILKKVVPTQVWRHAIVCNMLRKMEDTAPDFDHTCIDDMNLRVSLVRELRDAAPGVRVSPKDALAISTLYKKIKELRKLFINDCYIAKTQRFWPLYESMLYRPSLWSEFARIDQALYLFQMLASLCKNMTFAECGDRHYVSRCYDKVELLQKCISEQLMAPWELYQVIAIQAFFRRAIHGFEYESHESERIIPSLLAAGINFMHHALCVIDSADADEFIAPYKLQALNQPLHSFGVIVSRGRHNTWTRMAPRSYEEYRPFCPYADENGYKSWVRLERKQLTLVGSHQAWADLLYDRLEALEGRLDLWSAGIWDESRWKEIDPTLGQAEHQLWTGIVHHWNPLSVGFRVLADQCLMEESNM